MTEPTHNQANRTKKKQSICKGSQHLMNELTEPDNAGSAEPGLRLRKGHMSDTATTHAAFEEDSSEQSLLLVKPPLSSDQENCSEEYKHNDESPQEDEGFMGMSPLLQAHHAMERMEEFVCKCFRILQTCSCTTSQTTNPRNTAETTPVWEGRWRVIPHDVLPDWLKDNDYLLHGHRPPMPSFRACFKSIFRIHTETGNIWTHLLGCVFFLCLGIFYMFRPNMSFVAPVQEKVVVGLFFLGAILCLSFSWLFHTVYCHSEGVSRLFSKLDYSGIALLIMGSFVPWLYYSFYCNPQPCFIYLIVICVLGIAAIIVSQWDMFATPEYRGVRAGVFLGLGLSGIIPTLHFVISEGLLKAATMGQIGWLALMACLYITGAALYAARIPERFFPGKCDIWFHSHQLFHVFVVAGAFVHFHGVSNLQEFRFTLGGGCTEEDGMQ
ncbi:adiponectin receptor protein 2 isoform X1 [Heliangelus exortis]|uniref:adiponectin receptor protein 2 isoform X1 n=2 Tax=Heliangelus exortis TaxID=472823 RepID=UPI003A95644A